MDEAKGEQEAVIRPGTGGFAIEQPRRTRRRPAARRRLSVLTVVVLAIVGVLSATVGTAGAATPGYRYYDLTRDGRTETAAWVDAYGRVTHVYFDLNRDGYWETLARDMNVDGYVDEVWFDTAPNHASWETLIIGNMRYTGMGQTAIGAYYQHPGPYGTLWAGSGFTSTWIGGGNGYLTNGLPNLLNTIAALNGSWA